MTVEVIKVTLYDMSTYTTAGSSPMEIFVGYYNPSDSSMIRYDLKNQYDVQIPSDFKIPYSEDLVRYFVEIKMKTFNIDNNVTL